MQSCIFKGHTEAQKGTLKSENLPRVTQFTVFLYIKFEKLVAMDVLVKGT
jgi:hypothetical protein